APRRCRGQAGGETAAALTARVLELGVLAVLPAVVVRESVETEAGNRRHAELGALRGEPCRLVEVQLFFLARDGILDPREGNLVDLTIADLHLRAHPGQLELEGRENRVEPGSGHRDEDVEGEARVAAP